MTELKFPKASVIRTFTLQTDLINPPDIRLELTPAGGRDKQKHVLLLAGSATNEEDIKKQSPGDLMKLLEMFEDIIPIVSAHVIGWDLTLDGKPIPCTDEENAKWLEPLLWEMVEPARSESAFDPGDEEKKADTWLWTTIMKIISDRGNFLKN